MGLQFLLLLLRLMVMIISFLEATTSTIAESEKNCTISYCGDVKISFPFGIGNDKGCSFNSWFEIDCRVVIANTTPRPFLRRANLEVYSFQGTNLNHRQELYDLYSHEFYTKPDSILVKSPVISRNCSAVNGVNERDKLNLEGSPFFFSAEYNWFFAVGCNTLATLAYDNKTIGGCISTCESPGSDHETISRNDLGDYDGSNDILCYGIKCCQTTLPPYLQTFKPTFRSLEPGRSDDRISSCTSSSSSKENNITAFIAYRDYVSSNTITEDASKPYVIVSLDWAILNATQQQLGIDESTTTCQKNDIQIRANGTFHNVTSLKCYCVTPMASSGNPYLPDGCSCSNNPGECYSYWRKPHKSKTAAIIGVCSALGALVLIILAWFLFKILKKKMNQKRKEKFFKRNGGLLLQQKLFSSDGRVEETKIFNSKELEKATDRFNVDRVLGQGGQGTVYKGMLSDGRIVAVKKSKIIDEGSIDQFINEVVILSRINHRNVVKLFGCCLETDVPLLVYEFVPNGTLFHHIHDPSEEFPLSWERRLQIATEMAGAFSYLHYAASVPIYHRDIKSTNILLDDKYKAKVSDFGTSKTIAIDQTHMTTLVQGTFGYLDPEFFRSSQFTDKSDVYSFGVVIVELLTGRRPICSDKSQENRSLAALFVEAMEENKLMEILDPLILKEGWREEMMVVADLARRCLNMNGKKRPTMKEVAVALEGIRMSRGQTSTTGQQDTYDEVVGYDDIDMNDGLWDTSSSSRGTGSYRATASSLDADPLLLNKP